MEVLQYSVYSGTIDIRFELLFGIEIWSFCTNNVNAVSLAVTKINVFNLYQCKNIFNNWSSNKLCLIYICITYTYNDKQHYKVIADFIDAIFIPYFKI